MDRVGIRHAEAAAMKAAGIVLVVVTSLASLSNRAYASSPAQMPPPDAPAEYVGTITYGDLIDLSMLLCLGGILLMAFILWIVRRFLQAGAR